MSDYKTTLPEGFRFHHVGVPVSTPVPNMRYIPHLKFSVTGYDSSPFKYEWMYFDDDCPLPEVVKTKPHLCFEVDDLDAAIKGYEILIAPTSPVPELRVAFILHDGAPIELLEIVG
ncbi:MAG: hypothetical protein JKY31_11545 [Rhodobacteraceae bacterium]|nr:hypothetical protein [Paracoccaceae bacterium]